ncbi:hypothetical protein [Flavobacterium tistrianum]|uniref:hypothetical protein n=1 Tax=Flavobacterium tistrianum TaxID=1685414 RepID=UPI0013A684D0|nr:hypothetical protein [Flavobacterium tistrianum]KAF2338150.1 hypothetical protein DMB71_19155 [Flavobacterium tistrianum]
MLLIVSCSEDKVETSGNQGALEKKMYLCTTKEFDTIVSNPTGRVSLKGSYWKTGQTIRVKFLNGDTSQRNYVIWFASQWACYANLKFIFVDDNQTGDIKVRFNANSSSSPSVIGTQALQIPQNNPSLQIGYYSNTTVQEYGRAIMHEFGHALGLLHEHQNPLSPIQWNASALYAEYTKSGWTKADVDSNIINKLSTTQVDYSNFDINSIMLYPISASLTLNNYSTPWNTEISFDDKVGITRLYPFPAVSTAVTSMQTASWLYGNLEVYSLNRRYKLVMMSDGNLVIWDILNGGAKAIWVSGTNVRCAGSRLVWRGDGDLVMYDLKNRAVWHTNTLNNVGGTLLLDNDGILKVYSANRALLWDSASGKSFPIYY